MHSFLHNQTVDISSWTLKYKVYMWTILLGTLNLHPIIYLVGLVSYNGLKFWIEWSLGQELIIPIFFSSKIGIYDEFTSIAVSGGSCKRTRTPPKIFCLYI